MYRCIELIRDGRNSRIFNHLKSRNYEKYDFNRHWLLECVFFSWSLLKKSLSESIRTSGAAGTKEVFITRYIATSIGREVHVTE